MAAEAVAKGASLNHISRESSDIRRLANFYKEIFGFEEVESPNFGDFKVIWLHLPSAFYLHLIERDPTTKLPEGPWSATSPTADPKLLPRGHHICFSVSNVQSFLQTLKEELKTREEEIIEAKLKQGFVCRRILKLSLSIHLCLRYLRNQQIHNRLTPISSCEQFEKGIETCERSLPNGKIKQIFFFDPDGNGLEVASREE